ncbi:hypothetical protein BASA82_000857 [Batrachochytrium salamandrivorans]|nr:hypothetical protein BASA60_010181 [Batrachochytrium salamandrivorans]KAH9262044.1 hypothetical protein BASA82_000873 [Batrachochytrium salamandrivorans]KAH9262081.1 hypothetical protein BASA82_000857 [Batrachochytrium salamandrivorans]KAH9269947.1 hypothetical protein BASA83_007933 [Batrachochytrium salamandrivorans]
MHYLPIASLDDFVGDAGQEIETAAAANMAPIKADGAYRRAVVTLRSTASSTTQPPQDWVVLTNDLCSFWAIEATCPHSGGPLHLGDIEDICSDQPSIVCPWHEYRFSLVDGICSTIELFRADCAKVLVQDRCVTLLHPVFDTVERVRFISTPTQKHSSVISSQTHAVSTVPAHDKSLNTTMSLEADCTSLVDYAIVILNTADPSDKVALTFKVANLWNTGNIDSIEKTIDQAAPDIPARLDSLGFVAPSKTKKLGKGGTVASRIAILHSLANIEQWAIDLAWDIIARFSTETPIDNRSGLKTKLPRAFFTDFVRIAYEEATHFTYLSERLQAMGSHYGAMHVHAGLWDSAIDTKHSLGARLAIVHMVHEARGLDVNPQTIEKFARAQDMASVEKLTRIHDDEITHVASGQRWFSWLCSIQGEDRYAKFHEFVRQHFRGPLKPPFNDRDRLIAGLDPKYYLPLASNS